MKAKGCNWHESKDRETNVLRLISPDADVRILITGKIGGGNTEFKINERRNWSILTHVPALFHYMAHVKTGKRVSGISM